MSRLLFPLILLTVLMVFPWSVNSQAPPKTKSTKIIRQPVARIFAPAFKGKPEEEIEGLEHKLSDAERTRDTIALKELMSERILFSGVIADRDKIIALLKAVNTKYYSLEKSDMRIEIYGDTAVATGIQRAEIGIENGSTMSQTVFMNTWKKIDGKWRCIASS